MIITKMEFGFYVGVALSGVIWFSLAMVFLFFMDQYYKAKHLAVVNDYEALYEELEDIKHEIEKGNRS